MKNLLLIGLAAAVLPFAAKAQVLLTEGHHDIGINFSTTTGWDLHIHAEDTGLEYEPGDAIFVVNSPFANLPVDAEFGSLSGVPAITASEFATTGLKLGIGAEDLAPGIFVGDSVLVAFQAISGPVGGVVAVWRDDGFGSPVVSFINTSGSFTAAAGGHTDFNFSFTQLGTYVITLRASGELGSGAVLTTSDFTFQVIPEPSSAALLAGGMALAALQLRRRPRSAA